MRSSTDPGPLDPVLEGVYRRGYRLRRQKQARRLVAVGAALQLVLALPLLVTADDDPDSTRPRVATAPLDETTTTTAPEVLGVTYEATTTTLPPAPTTTTTVAPTTTTLYCRNSHNPACGPFRWDPPPKANQPLVIDITHVPLEPKAGETVVFTFRARDPDASRITGRTGPCFSDGPGCLGGSQLDGCEEPFGPWDPPRNKPLDTSFTQEHVFTSEGTFTVHYVLSTSSDTCPGSGVDDPYGSYLNHKIEVTVAPAEGATPQQ